MPEVFLTEKQAAAVRHCSTRTLQRERVCPPSDPLPFIRAGRRILYCLSDLEDWLSRRRYHSTAEADLADHERGDITSASSHPSKSSGDDLARDHDAKGGAF